MLAKSDCDGFLAQFPAASYKKHSYSVPHECFYKRVLEGVLGGNEVLTSLERAVASLPLCDELFVGHW